MTEPDLLAALRPVVDALEKLGIEYYLAGSVASSYYGIVRATVDADLVARVETSHAQPLVEALSGANYIDGDMIREAVEHQSMFNVVHYDTALKVDVYVTKQTAWDREAFDRRRPEDLEAGEPPIHLGSPEDVLLLLWYQMGNEISERQWRDALGVLRMRDAELDQAYLDHWAEQIGVADLLARAREEAAAR